MGIKNANKCDKHGGESAKYKGNTNNSSDMSLHNRPRGGDQKTMLSNFEMNFLRVSCHTTKKLKSFSYVVTKKHLFHQKYWFIAFWLQCKLNNFSKKVYCVTPIDSGCKHQSILWISETYYQIMNEQFTQEDSAENSMT